MKRIQRSRKKGSKLPPNTVCVTRPGRWGNPWKLDERTTAAVCVASFRRCLLRALNGWEREDSDPWGKPVTAEVWQHFERMAERLPEVRGKNLACWCKIVESVSPLCHADVLLELANREESRNG